MSFTLKRVEINNIRVHEHFVFEPAIEGVTSISGENGSGKSTIVDSFAWALYGTRASGIRNKSLIKEGVNPREKDVSVKVTMQVGTVDYIVERKIITEHGATECNVWGRVNGEDFNHIAGPGVTHVEKFIRQELGLNEKGFLTAVFIQQKQVDQIVSASPRERGEVIEELTGIATITEAIGKANENTRGLQKAASVMQTGDIDKVSEMVEKQKLVYDETLNKEKKAIAIFKEMKEKYAEESERYELETIKVNKRHEMQNRIENLKEQVSFLEKQSKSDIEFIASYKEKYGTTIYKDSNEIKNKLDLVREEYSKIVSSYQQSQLAIQEYEEYIKKCEILINDMSDDIDDNIKSIKEDIKDLKIKLEKVKSEITMMNAEIKHSKASHDHINGDEKNCPVCKGEIQDPEALKAEIESEIKQYQDNLKKLRKDKKDCEESLEAKEEVLKELNVAKEALLEKDSTEAKLKDELSKLKQFNDSAKPIKMEIEVLEAEYEQSLKIEADKDALEAAKERSLTVNTTISEKKNEIDSLEDEIKTLDSMNDRSYKAFGKRIEEMKDRLANMSVSGRELQGKRKLEYERYQDSLERLKHEQEVLEQYNEISNQIHKSSAASSVLQEFKRDRIEQSIPTLEFFASDFLSKFTGGVLTKLTLDDKFNAFVTTATGHVRPIAQLSGGELSATAIALRLGIAMLINANEKSVLILDEVLVSMDEDRARQIMETIGAMTNAQIIFIAHNSDINSIADKTVLVSKQ